jgi:hypothetical protein
MLTGLWAPERVEPIPLLADLREQVLRHGGGRRCPKWAFRMAADLAVQLQPRPTLLARSGAAQRVLEFQGLAACEPGGEVPANIFKGGNRAWATRDAAWLQLKFELFAYDTDDHWTFRTLRVLRAGQVGREMSLKCRRRLIDEPPRRLTSLRPELMLRSACLICGKALTDAVSMSRLIGPECYGSGALTLPMDRDRLAERLFASPACEASGMVDQ